MKTYYFLVLAKVLHQIIPHKILMYFNLN